MHMVRGSLLYSFSRAALFGVVFLAYFAQGKRAFALDEIYTPDTEYHEISVEYSGDRSFDPQGSKNDAQDHQLTLEAGLAPRWTAETSATFAKDPGDHVRLTNLEVGNRFQFTETGEYAIDSGLLVAYDFATQGHQADSTEIKLLLQKDIGLVTSTANIGFTQDVGAFSSAGGPDYVFLENTRYRYSTPYQPGIELQSDLGQAHEIGHLSQQTHYAGPALYGKLAGRLKYQLAYLLGLTDASAQSAARALVEYEFHY